MISTVFLGYENENSYRNEKFVNQYEKLDPCTVFYDEEKALSYLEKNRTMLTVFDSFLGKTDVISFIKKAKEKNIACDFIVFTADGNRDTITELYYCGVFMVVVKPFDYGLFCSVVDDYERYLLSGKQNVAERKKLPITSALDAEVLSLTGKDSYTEKELSLVLGKPVIIIKQSLNRLILGGMIKSETVLDDGIAVTKYKKIL